MTAGRSVFAGRLAALFLAAGAFLAHGGPLMRRLGFYHDDWALLARMAAHGGGPWELLLAQLQGPHLYRPLSVVCWTVPYALFGLEPLPWHLLMSALSAAAALALYAVLRGFGAPRAHAVLGALLFLAFPNKDSTLFWPDVSLILTTSLLCVLLAFLAHMRHVAGGGGGGPFVSAALLILGLCAYEQAFFLLPLWLLAPAAGAAAVRRRRIGFALTAAALALFALCKFVLLPLFVPYNKSMQISPGHFIFVYYMAARSLLDPRWLVYLGRLAWQGLLWHPALVLAAAALPFLAWRLLPREEARDAGAASRLFAWGLALCGLAYLPLCFSAYAPSAYDHMNRLNQLPAAGAAAAACGLALALRRPMLLAAASSFALALSPAFAEVWAESYRRQLAVREAVLGGLDDWPAGRPLVVRLPELYAARKAPVFLASYDVSSAIYLWTGQEGRSAHVYGPWTRPEKDGIRTDAGLVSYDEALLLDMEDGRIRPLDRRRAAVLPPVMEPWESPLRFW